MLYIGIGLGIFSILGLIILLIEWSISSKKAKTKAEREQREQQRQAIIQLSLSQAAQAKKEAEKAAEQAIQEEYAQLQVNLAALDTEIQALHASKNSISQQGLTPPPQIDLWLQKRQLEKRLIELEMQGVTQKSLYDDAHQQIERIDSRLEIIEEISDRGEVGKLIIEQQAEIRNKLEQVAQDQAITCEKLKKDLEKQFTPTEVQNILMKADMTMKQVIAMTAAALGKQPSSPALLSGQTRRCPHCLALTDKNKTRCEKCGRPL